MTRPTPKEMPTADWWHEYDAGGSGNPVEARLRQDRVDALQAQGFTEHEMRINDGDWWAWNLDTTDPNFEHYNEMYKRLKEPEVSE